MFVAWADKFMVDFISHDNNIICQADFGHAAELIPAPNPAYRIVRGAEDKKLYIVSLYLGFKVDKIYMVAAIFIYQRAVDQLAVVGTDNLGKWIVNRLLNQHCLSWLGEGSYCDGQGKYHARGNGQFLVIYLPVVMLGKPFL